MNAFGPLIEAAREKLGDAASALQTAAQEVYGRTAVVVVGKLREEVQASIPTLLLLDGDEHLATEQADRAAIGGTPRCVRELGVCVLAARRASFVADLDALVSAAIADLHHQPLSGARRVDYMGGGPEVLPGNAAGWTAIFHVLYQR